MIPWLIILAVVLILLLGISLAMRIWRKGNMPPTDYYGWFWIGILWTIVGIISVIFGGREQSFFLIMGLAFAIAGLAHRKEWKENRKQWHKMDKRRRLVMILSMIALAALIAAMIVMEIART